MNPEFREGGKTAPIRRCIQGSRRGGTYQRMHSGKEEGQYLSGDVRRERCWAEPIRRCGKEGWWGST
jgi:hypothetical protein